MTDAYLQTAETMVPQELVYGRVREAASPTPSHQTAVGAVYRLLWSHIEASGAGLVLLSPIDVILDRERALVVQPDVVAVMHDRLHIVTDRVWGAPDLVVEVMSPEPRIGRLDERLAWFAHYGVRECWLIHHLHREIEVIAFANGSVVDRQRFEGDERVTSVVVAQLEVTPGRLFDRLIL